MQRKLIGENEIKELFYICQIFPCLKYIKINLYEYYFQKILFNILLTSSQVDKCFYEVFSIILKRMSKLKIDFSQ